MSSEPIFVCDFFISCDCSVSTIAGQPRAVHKSTSRFTFRFYFPEDALGKSTPVAPITHFTPLFFFAGRQVWNAYFPQSVHPRQQPKGMIGKITRVTDVCKNILCCHDNFSLGMDFNTSPKGIIYRHDFPFDLPCGGTSPSRWRDGCTSGMALAPASGRGSRGDQCTDEFLAHR